MVNVKSICESSKINQRSEIIFLKITLDIFSLGLNSLFLLILLAVNLTLDETDAPVYITLHTQMQSLPNTP